MISIDLDQKDVAPEMWPEIFEYREDIEGLKKALEGFGVFDRIIVVGNGGSITSYDAYFWALCSRCESQSVWTMDPALLERTKKHFPNDGKTVVVAVSKSGNTLGQIESLLYFCDYPTIVVTNPNSGALSEIAKKLNWEIIDHPPVGGRFSGATASAFVPAYLAGMNIDEIQSGISAGYTLKNEAYSLANYYFKMEKDGYSEIYLNCYCECLMGFGNLIIQLMHESVCKDGKGQTFYFAMGPEAQHHTNQRFLGGKKNVIGTFIVAENSSIDLKQVIPSTIRDVSLQSDKLSILDEVSFQDALKAEYLGTKEDADLNRVPNITITLDVVNEKSVGELVAFWHMVAFYSAKLRQVDPFSQPAVENSKKITLEILKKHR